MKWRILPLLLCLCTLFAGCSTNSVQSQSSDSSTVYLQNKGSDTIVNLALAWAERYQTVRPDVSISVTGGGSGTGITSLINGTVDIANASRQITADEIKAAEANGIQPVEHVIARDAIAVIVNPENPVDELTLDQISQIYRGTITNWKEVGGEDRPIVRLSRETNSGTHVYFLEAVVRLGNKNDKALFTPLTLLLPSSEGIITEVRDNPNAIGYDGLGYVTPEVKVLAVSPGGDKPYVLPSIESVNNQSYPIARDLYMYSKKDSSQAVLDYLQWTLSPEAQQIVSDLGFVPINSTP